MISSILRGYFNILSTWCGRQKNIGGCDSLFYTFSLCPAFNIKGGSSPPPQPQRKRLKWQMRQLFVVCIHFQWARFSLNLTLLSCRQDRLAENIVEITENTLGQMQKGEYLSKFSSVIFVTLPTIFLGILFDIYLLCAWWVISSEFICHYHIFGYEHIWWIIWIYMMNNALDIDQVWKMFPQMNSHFCFKFLLRKLHCSLYPHCVLVTLGL